MIKNEEEEEFIFKTELTALDYFNSRPKKEKEKLAEEIRLIAVSVIKPRLTYEEIMGMELSRFNRLLQSYMKKIGTELHKNIGHIQSKPSGAMKKGFNFVPISNMNPEKEDIPEMDTDEILKLLGKNKKIIIKQKII